MKIFITNKDKFDEHFENSTKIHQVLFNKITTDILNNKIEIIVHLPSYGCVFEFIGKNKDVYFYTFIE